jgi:hypothetical protein
LIPGGEDGNDEDGGAGDPPALVKVPFDLQDRHPVEEGQQEEGARVQVEQEEPGQKVIKLLRP